MNTKIRTNGKNEIYGIDQSPTEVQKEEQLTLGL